MVTIFGHRQGKTDQVTSIDRAWLSPASGAIVWVGTPADVIERLLAAGKEIVQPNCVYEYGGVSFDLNAWRDHGRLHLHDLRSEGDLVELARRAEPVAGLSDTTVGNVSPSARWRAVFHPLRLEDALRAAPIVDGACWGYLPLHRGGARDAFDAVETPRAGGLDRLPRGRFFSVVLGGDGTNDLPGEAPAELPELPLLVADSEIHSGLPCPIQGVSRRAHPI